MTQPGAAAPPMSRLRRLALVLAGGAFLLPFALGRLVELAFKAINADDVDVTQGLAYLRPLLIIGFALFAVMLAVTVAVIVRLQRAEGRDAARPAWVVLVTQVVLIVVVLVLTVLVDAVEAAWTSSHGG